MANIFIILPILLIAGAAVYIEGYNGDDLPPGPYCGKRNECCTDRRDSCSHDILDTKCYCDEFCNRSRVHDDCCPDYVPVCLGLPPPLPVKLPCQYKGKLYLPGTSRMDNCNKCECIETPNDGATWRCDDDPCLMSDNVVEGVNSRPNSWRATTYQPFLGKKLSDGIIYKLGTLPLGKETKRMGPIRYDKDIVYPNRFDARERWPGYITPVQDQGWCGSDWALSIASIASDRFAIQSNGAEKPVLSPQVLLSCNVRQQQGCKGGHIEIAWPFARHHGLVDEQCFPYKEEVTRCPFKPNGDLVEDGCRLPANIPRTERYKVGPPGRLQKEHDIMYDIMESGPVQAIMMVYQDFFHYRDGIYRLSPYGNKDMKGYHSVRIIGWGEEAGQKYWTVANTWGEQWGENGYFRIARGRDESGIESFVVTVLVDVAVGAPTI